jgi:hypothetical protein
MMKATDVIRINDKNPAHLTFWCLNGLEKGKAVPITGRGGPQGCEISRFSHFLDNWLTDGSEIGSPLPPGRFLVLISVSY